jgi:hypothetical protein
MIKLRVDVDYPYPSRMKSFFSVAMNIKWGRDYLKNSKEIAKMINESNEEAKAYWFFTYQTQPDLELLKLLKNDKHEIALHVVNEPYDELKLLEKTSEGKIKYYTIHGTKRLIARLIWRRKLWGSQVKIPYDFPLESFHKYPTFCLDYFCHIVPPVQAVPTVKEVIRKGEVLEIHPEWLHQRGSFNHRGPYFETLKKILCLDKEDR